MGHWLVDNDLLPDFVISSPAARAIATARLASKAMGLDSDAIHEKRNIYLAELETLLTVVRRLPDSARRALIVGHNPGLEQLFAALSETVISPYDDSGRMPTCALAVLRLPAPWASTAPQTATVTKFILPRELPPVA